MKLQVITDNNGKVLGTYSSGTQQAGAPVFGGFTPINGQKVHEIDAPQALLDLKDTTELHTQVEKLLQHK